VDLLKAFFVVLVLTTAAFAFAKAPACAVAMINKGEFSRWRNLWISLTVVVFLAHNFWLYIIVAGILLFFAARREPNKCAMFFFLLFAVPPIQSEISGAGAIKNFFNIDYYRLLSLTVLLPAYLLLRKQPDIERFGRSLPDKLILLHMLFFFVLKLTSVSITDALRHGVFYAFIEIFLPYYVTSRSLRTLKDFRSALMGLTVAALVVCVLGVFEWGKGWPLYGGVGDALGTGNSQGFVVREGSLRAVVTFGLPIQFGYCMAIAFGLFLYVGKFTVTPTARLLGWLALLAGLLASVSRGPWVGAAVMLLVFLVTGASAVRAITKLAVLGLLCLPLLAVPVRENIILDYLPFVGTIQSKNVDYRLQLIDAGLAVIMQYPWFGNRDAMQTPEMLTLKHGEGIIDVTNAYLQLTLERGLVGLSVFVGFFAAVAAGILGGMKSLTSKNDERHVLGQALLATLAGILVIIGTVSTILVIPWMYWSISGLGVAYARMVTPARAAVADG
jgi:hypothetical protein